MCRPGRLAPFSSQVWICLHIGWFQALYTRAQHLLSCGTLGILLPLFYCVLRSLSDESLAALLTLSRPAPCNPQALANSLWAFATLRWYPSRLMPHLVVALDGRIGVMTVQEMANSLWACAK